MCYFKGEDNFLNLASNEILSSCDTRNMSSRLSFHILKTSLPKEALLNLLACLCSQRWYILKLSINVLQVPPLIEPPTGAIFAPFCDTFRTTLKLAASCTSWFHAP